MWDIQIPIVYWFTHCYKQEYVLKLINSEKATKLCKIFTLLLSYVVPVKSKVKILQNFVAFSEYVKSSNAVP